MPALRIPISVFLGPSTRPRRRKVSRKDSSPGTSSLRWFCLGTLPFSATQPYSAILISRYRYSSLTYAIYASLNLFPCSPKSYSPSTTVICSAAAGASTGGTPVPKNTILVVGATGTLGRQVVRKALDEGYEVRCSVRPRQNPADFLRDWGATTVQMDLTDPTSIPAALVGIHTVIDCSTARPEESTTVVDWEGKVALIQSAQAMGIQRYIFFSIMHCDKHPEVPLMNIKKCTEEFLEQSGMDYTVFRLAGFMQAIIGNYAVPILEEKAVWGTSDSTKTAYLDTMDAAKMTMASLRAPEAIGKTNHLLRRVPPRTSHGQRLADCWSAGVHDGAGGSSVRDVGGLRC